MLALLPMPRSVVSRCFAAILSSALIVPVLLTQGSVAAGARSTAAFTPAPAVINFSTIRASRAAEILRSVYPRAIVRVDAAANAVIVVASPNVVSGMRTIATGIDVKSPIDQTVDAYGLHTVTPADAISRVARIFPQSRLVSAPNHTVMIQATPQDLALIKQMLGAMDTPLATPSPRPVYPADAVRILQGNAKAIARNVARSVPNVRISVSGPQVLVSGAPDDVTHAKALIAQLDQPQPGVQFTQVYRLRYVDATSVAELVQRSFRNINVQVDKELNAISIYATAPMQQRIADAIAQLDQGPQASASAGGSSGAGPSSNTVISLKAAIPGLNGGPSTTASDIAQAVSQALQQTAPDLHITVPANSTQLILSGSDYSISQAKTLIAQLDTPQALVVLDTEVLEIDEGVQKQLGLKFPSPALSTTYSEVQTGVNADGTLPRMLRLQALTRTPLSLQAQLDFLVSQNKARILEDPRITTVSGRTASLRAGETVNILTTTGGGTGTVATTQVQSFQTGVTLDITPVVNDGDYITVSLHPSVNTIAGVSAAGVPNIQTRDTTTTVGLHDGETIVIGGLIEDNNSTSSQKIPFLGDLPLVGKMFRDTSVNHSRNELIVTVTPHIVRAGESASFGPPLPSIPTPAPLPTLAPGTSLPSPSGRGLPRATLPPPVVYHPAPATSATTPVPKPASSPRPAATPIALPTAFAQTNTYTYGQSPANNYAGPSDPPQIYYAQVRPTVVKPGDSVDISVITSTNVSALSLGASPLMSQATFTRIGPGQWHSSFAFSTAGLAAASGTVQLMLTAKTNMGGTVSLPIPFSLPQP